jgi:hypothetical protein
MKGKDRPRKPPSKVRRVLRVVLLVNIAATLFHYGDNVLRPEQYPDPMWLTPAVIAGFWLALTPMAVAGYLLFTRGWLLAGSVLLFAYSILRMLALFHFHYGHPDSLPFMVSLSIVLEVVFAVALIVAVAVEAAEARRARRRPRLR